jgi:hypothetical protein
MKKKTWCVLAFVLLLWPLAASAESPLPERSPINTWIERPWEVRYFMQVKQPSTWEFLQQLAAKNNARGRKLHQSWQILFNPTHIVRIPDWSTGNPEYPHDQAVVVIEFDKEGFATTPNNDNLRLRGRLNEIRRIELSDETSGKVYELAHWFTGRDEDTPMEVVPAFCRGAYEIPRVFTEKDDSYIYGNWFKPEAGGWLGFGCREWAYQLHSSDRPYIDVTTYGPKNKRYPHGTYINDFIGWSTFEARKPVIGKHADTWYCLYECPNGDSPGKIENIGQWAARNGWNPPRPPTRVPTFTDDPRRRGTYVN